MKLIIGAALAACLSSSVFGLSSTINNSRVQEIADIKALEEMFNCSGNDGGCLSGEFMQKIQSDYYKNNQQLLTLIDKETISCYDESSAKRVIQNGIMTAQNKVIKGNFSKSQLDYVKNRSLNELYIPLCAATLEKSIGSLSFSKKNITGVGSAYNNQNYCGNFHKYLIHLSTESNDMKYSFGTFVSRFSTENLKVFQSEKDLHIQAKAFLHYLEYGNMGFDPIIFAEIYNKNNQSSASKIGGKDEELETFMVAIISGSFKTADNILKANIENSKKIFELIENSDNCDFNKPIIDEVVIPEGFKQISKSDIKVEDLNYVYRKNKCIPFNEFVSDFSGNRLTPIESVDYLINIFGKKTKIAEAPNLVLIKEKDSNFVIYKDISICEKFKI